ncbi:MAG: S1C family serine protease [Anaerolineales bacterium]
MSVASPHRLRWLLLPLASAVLAALACGGPANTTPPPDTGGSTTGGESVSGAVSTLDGVQAATIQIESQGTFVDPAVGLEINAAGRGSGFLIDPSGLAVTNNHVVTGAALLKVWVGGESQARNARVLGVSECADLAVIDLDGDGYPYLAWYDEEITAGMDMYVAGYPLGDPEFTITRGVVSKAAAGGETSWASVESTIEYDATSNPGNSGGPVITPDGAVLAVHFAGNAETRQAFGIAAQYARSVVEELQFGRDVDSIGVNGQAVSSEDGSVFGIWVSSVKSGSPADRAGVRGGDIIRSMEGLVLATDGTMADYCDILRSHSPSDTLAIEVLRYDTSEVLEGQLNGRVLEVSSSFASDLGDTTGGSAGTYSGYTTITDALNAIQVDIPVEWTDVDANPFTDEGTDWASIWAAPDLQDFHDTWGTPGVEFNVTKDIAQIGGYVQVLDALRQRSFFGDCELDGRYDYEDPLYRGKYDYFVSCGGTSTSFLVLSAVPIDDPNAFLIWVDIQIVSDSDLEAADQILNTFQVVGTLP